MNVKSAALEFARKENVNQGLEHGADHLAENVPGKVCLS
jgi:hypothetical protein